MSAASDHVTAEYTITAWCMGVSDSIKRADLDSHMGHVSRKIKVYGVPNRQMIGYRDWKARRQYEIENGEILSLNYQKIRLISSTQRRIRFSTNETTVGKNGKMLQLTKNVLLELEDDGIWRVVEENVTNWKLKNIDLSKY